MGTTQLQLNIVLCLSLIFQCSFAVSPFGKIIPRFPSPLVNPENSPQQSLSNDQSSNNGLYETRYFTQILDHFGFRPESYQTFQQRYLINSTFWGGPQKNAPIFVYTGNEGDIEWFAQNTGFMLENAPRFNALLVFIEHRFYGKSIPFGGNKEVASSNSSTLGYLSSTQALADYATLITDLKKNWTAEDSPVVVFGGSYGGMLAAWFRLKYPHIAIGALSSSAPILNFDNITSPYSFSDIITRDFRSESENCYKVIKRSWQKIESTAKLQGGLEILRKSFGLCKSSNDAGYLEGWLQTALIYTAMTDYPTPSNFLNPLPAYPVKQMCKAIDDPRKGDDDFAKLYGAANIYYNHSGDVSCFDLMDDSDPHGLGGWQWQGTKPMETMYSLGLAQLKAARKEFKINKDLACTEMVLPTGGTRETSIFPAHKYDYSGRVDYCVSRFGVVPRSTWAPIEFGGHDIRRTLWRFGSNIIFFNGLRDPWSGGGVLKSISKSIVAIVAKKGAHHVDLRYSTSEDPEWLQDVRKKEIKIISSWISQYYLDLAESSF